MSNRRNRRSLSAPLIALTLERGATRPLQRQLYDQIREAILAGRLAPGARLPSSRALAGELACARNSVLGAYDQLFSEGYLEGRSGSGTYVSSVLPESLLGIAPVEAGPAPAGGDAGGGQRLSQRGQAILDLKSSGRLGQGAFRPGFPDAKAFPFGVWARLLARDWRQPSRELLLHGEPAGLPRLREAVAAYLRGARGLDCEADQVIITSGAQQCLDLAVRALLDPGDAVWVEEPGYRPLQGPLLASGARPVHLPVDAEGLSLSAGLAQAPGARMAVVTPSHHYPLGVVMSLPRRLPLLEWARDRDAWIIEDDYDSEYRYAGRPLAPLQGLDGAGRVIYVGSFSKVLFPSIRIAYLVAPRGLAPALVQVRAALDDHPSAVVQPALAAFMEEGHFAAHLRRMRRLYASRQQALLAAAGRHLEGLLTLQPDDAGLHLIAGLTPDLAARMDDRTASRRAREAGIVAPALSDFYWGKPDRQGLMLGYAGVPEDEIERAVKRLARALD